MYHYNGIGWGRYHVLYDMTDTMYSIYMVLNIDARCRGTIVALPKKVRHRLNKCRLYAHRNKTFQKYCSPSTFGFNVVCVYVLCVSTIMCVHVEV